MLSAWRSWCRLCGRQQSDIDIFMKSENISDISGAIQKYFSITITPCTGMPTMICTKCHEYISSLIQFADRCIKMDAMFSQLALGKISINDEELEQLRYHYGIDKYNFTVYEPRDVCDTELGSCDDSTVDATYLQEESTDTEDESDKDNILLKTRPKKPRRTKFDEKVKCKICDKELVSKRSLSQHFNIVHGSREKPFICEVCGKTFLRKGGLTEHMYTHTEETPFQCAHCPKMFKNMPLLKKHEDIHNGTIYVCPDCGLQLNTKRTLQMHMVVHSDQRKYKCQFCGNEFKRAKALKNHLILHSGLKPYACPFCDKTFANGSNCRSHKKKAHPVELAAMEAAGEVRCVTNIPKLEHLRAVPNKEIPELCENSFLEVNTTNINISKEEISTSTINPLKEEIIILHVNPSQEEISTVDVKP